MALLEVRELTKVFGGLVAVKNVSFDVEQGKIVSLIGPNGAGKTTIFSMITGFVQPTKGKIIFADKDITKLSTNKIATCGLITTFQKNRVFSRLTVEDAIMIGTHINHKTSLRDIVFRNKKFYSELEQSQKKVQEILNHTGLSHKKNFLCNELSYGEQRILEVAVALAAEPLLLLLDEPAVGLNNTESQNMMNMIYDIRNAGVTILLIEHDMNLVMNISDYVVVINFGEKIYVGTPKEVAINKKVIEAYLGA